MLRRRKILDVLDDAVGACSTTHIALLLGRTNRSTLRDLNAMAALGKLRKESNPSTAWWSIP
jgi:hypothetical protein